MNLSWYLYYGRQIGMSKREILITPFGEMQDMIACRAIDNGTASPKRVKKWRFEDAITLR